MVFIPIYTRSHWVASVLRIRSDGTPTLVYYDSAPSHQVRRDINRVFRKTLNIEVEEQSIQRQERDSMDCGIYMFSVYAGIFFRSPIKDLKSKVRRLRDFLSEYVANPSPKPTFLAAVQDILYERLVEGGNNGNERHSLMRYYTQKYSQHIRRFKNNPKTRSLFIAIAMIAIAEGKKRLVEWTNLTSQAGKRKLASGCTNDVADLLYLYGYPPQPFGKASREGEPEVIGTARPGPLFLQKGNEPTIQLPERVGLRTFVVGTCFVDDHYELCTSNVSSLVGLYVNSPDETPETVQPPRDDEELEAPTATSAVIQEESEVVQTTATSAARDETVPLDVENVIRDDELEVDPSDNAGTYLANTDTTPKNRSGRQLDGQGRTMWGSVCPRLWILNPHEHPLYLNTKESGEHALRLKWLRRFQKLPSEYLCSPVDEVVIDMLKKDAVARSYTWATFVRKLMLIQSALINLPLYSNQECGIDLKTYPRWVETVKLSKWMQQRSDSKETAVISVSQFQDLHRKIRHTMPLTALYLRLMWCTAARAGDVDKLKIRDVWFQTAATPDAQTTNLRSPQLGSDMIPISVTMKRGKGAYFRGTYIIHTAIPREDADQLHQLRTHRRTNQLLFPKTKDRREEALWALKQLEERAIVPSVRKSALCFLAEQGLTEEELMAISGHTRVETLHRYLGVGRQPTRGDVGLQERAAAALRRLRRPLS
ncbi:hypothetical protein, conserved [Angomonas deanei]|uniref:Ubiquitin-like protease family profile domain-containing protein n=1 Tax=Angomonas deanei TaxID=59799 RepID=A0A7G2CAJ2_9TRYP|nr:hypothetical protein, conserved [Angomonas deanei]